MLDMKKTIDYNSGVEKDPPRAERERKMMRRLAAILAVVACLAGLVPAAQAEVERNVLLDNAFKMLEEGNTFIERYNRITGADVQPIFASGVPYFFGGKYYDRMMANYPQYSKKTCQEVTRFYRKGTLYIYGLDCHGYICSLRAESGWSKISPLSFYFQPVYTDRKTHKKYDMAQYYIWWKYGKSSKPDNLLPELDQVKDTAQVGDLLIIHARGNHILMYIGTLRDYGFTEEEVPALAKYMDYPLMIHCGISPVYGERIQKVLDADPDYFKKVKTTNGGVQVSIWGVPRSDAEKHATVQGNDFDWFVLPNGQVMTIYDMTSVSMWRWLRLPEKVPVLKEKGGEEE